MKKQMKRWLASILCAIMMISVLPFNTFIMTANASNSVWNAWGNWSAWQDSPITKSDFVDVGTQQVDDTSKPIYETRYSYKTVYHYFRYSTKRVADGIGGSDISGTKYGSNYYTYDFDYELTISGSNGNYSRGYRYYYNATTGNTVSGNYITVWKCDPFTTQEVASSWQELVGYQKKTQYRYRTRTRTDSYYVTFNANGGSNSPQTQTVTNIVSKDGETLNPVTLTNAIPIKKYTITFNANGGNVSSASKEYSCTFNNWNTKADGTGTTYTGGMKYSQKTDLPLYAQWTNTTYGTLPTPTKTNARFDGWYTSETGGSKVTSTGTVSSTRILYAHWTDIYTVNFNANGGTNAPDSFTFYADDDNVILPTKIPAKSFKVTFNANGGSCSTASRDIACTFTKWNTKQDGSGASYVAGGSYIADMTATLYAQWTNNKVGALPSASKTGYSFNGWYSSSTGGSKISDSTIVAGNTTYYAQWTAIGYKIAFNGNGSTSGTMSDFAMTYDAAKQLTANTYSKTGYSFGGWNTKADGSGTTYTDKASVKNLTSTKDSMVTLYAQWTANDYSISFNGNGSTIGAMSNLSMTYNVAKSLTENGFSRTGYSFTEWNTKADGSGTTYANKASVKNLSSTKGATIILYAQWSAKAYTITFQANGGTCSPISKSVTYNSMYGVLPTPTKTGYVFNGWYTASTGGTKVTADTKVTITAAQTLYAQWTAIGYTIAFNGNGSTSGSMTNLSMTYDVVKNLTANTYSKTGYSFIGWNTKTDGSGTTYADKASLKNLASTKDATVILYAQWSLVCNITYNANGGTGVPSKQTIVAGNSLKLCASTPTKTFTVTFNVNTTDAVSAVPNKSLTASFVNWKDALGNTYLPGNSYVFTNHTELSAQWKNPAMGSLSSPSRSSYYFSGWFDAVSGGKQYTAESVVDKNLTLYAHWTLIPTYTVSYDLRDGSDGPSAQTKVEDVALSLSTVVPVKSFDVVFNPNGGSCSVGSRTVSCTFNSWNTKADGTGTTYAPGDKYKDNKALSLNAIWQNPVVGSLPTASKAGYLFNGWYTASNAGIKISGTTIITKDSTYYAQWTPISYVVSFNGNGSTFGTMSDLAMTYDAAKQLTSNAYSKTGYSFIGWNTKADGSGTTYTDKALVKNLTSIKDSKVMLYAQWKANCYTVTFQPNGGVCSTASKSVIFDAKYGDLPKATRIGYEFKGWYNAETNGSQVTANTIVKTGANHTVYAQWLLICTITYDANGGINKPDSFTCVEGQSTTLSTKTPQKSFSITFDANGGSCSTANKSTKCIFNGWKEAKNVYLAGATATFYQDTTLYAQWGNPSAGDLPTPTKKGYHFVGWYDAKTGGNLYTKTSNVSKSMTLFSHWEANTYTVQFVSGGKELSRTTMDYDKEAKLTYGQVPIKEGYSFISWKINGKSYYNSEFVKNLTDQNNGVVVCEAVWNKDLTLDDLTYSFGNSHKAYNYPDDYVIPLPAYRMVFGETTLGESYYWNSRNKKWGGNCYGMSSTSTMFNNGASGTAVSDYNAEAQFVSELQLNNKKGDTSLKQYIEAMQVSQKCKVIQDSYKEHRNKLNDLVLLVDAQIKTNELPIIGVFGPEGGHAVVAIRVERTTPNAGRLYIYDCNFPQTERYIDLIFDGNGKCIGWRYCVNDTYDWGSENKECWITYVPYADFEFVWRNRGNQELLSKKNSNVIYTNSANCFIKDTKGNVLCSIKDGVFTSQQDDVYKLILTEIEDSPADSVTYIFLPIDQYTVVNQDQETTFEAGIVNVDLGASVVTTASAVTFTATDDENVAYVSIDSKKGDSFELTMQSSLDFGFDEITLSGVADGSKIVLSEQEGAYDYQINNSTSATLSVDGKVQSLDKQNMIQSIEIIMLPKTEYTYRINRSIDKTGMNLLVHYTDGTQENITDTSKIICNGLDPLKTGMQKITVQYENATTSYDITVRLAWWQWIIKLLLLGFLWY